ncbi:sensor histidine kinase [Paenibacillus cremeus]|uniref:sensor histidine kinase n=1 Tax=Paenibacillus cremeus TaxID=2163881 RepID=UPI0021BD463D|nr:sensor histidine kinase [Paenibacillus cremeus]
MKTSYKVKSIQFIITVSFTLITVLVMLFVGVVLYNKFSRTAEQNAYLYNQQIVEQVSFSLENYLDDMAQVFSMVDDKIHRSAGIPNAKLTEQLEMILDTREDIVSMGLFTAQGELVTGLPDKELHKNTKLLEQGWFKSAVENPNHLTFSLPHIQNLYKGEYRWVVSMSKGVKIQRGNETVDGVLLVDVNFKTIDDVSRRISLGQKGYAYIIDESGGNIIYHPQQQLIYIGLKYENVEQALKYAYGSFIDNSTGSKRLITIQTVKNVGWRIVGVSYMDEIVATKKEISDFIMWLLLFVIIFVLMLSAFMSSRISLPIKRLEKSMRKVEQGDFDISIQVQGEDEVGRLSRRFNFMVVRIRELMAQIIQEQETKRKNELDILQAQINPHFLYNTLNSVVRMAGVGKKEEVITMITSLSKFFRISLSKGKHVITVQDELEHVRHYLIIQQMRFKNQFEFTIEAEEEAFSCRTLKLILQPIVENSIYHGIEPIADVGHIYVRAAVVGGKLRLQVEDNGLGMAPEVPGKMLRGEAVMSSREGSGVGMRNVLERIRLYYGEPYGLEIESELEVGTTVTVWLPVVREEEGSDA